MKSDIIKKIEVDGMKIGEQARSGDFKAERVVSLYNLLFIRYDHATEALLEASYEDWKRDNAK